MSEYIQHRLAVAGSTGKIGFSPDALKAIYNYSGGVPRLINLLADKALLRGFVKEIFFLDHLHIQDCIKELDGEHLA